MIKATILNEIEAKIKSCGLFYVCRDLERAIGLNLTLSNYYIITNQSDYSKSMAKRHKNIILVKEDEQLDTLELLENHLTQSLIKKGSLILVFKNTKQIEEICAKSGWVLLNPKAELANIVEEKISQVKWLGELAKYLPSHKIDICKNIVWQGKNFILQFNRSHTGLGTYFIESKEQLEEIKNKFPEREARITDFIEGPFFTNNNTIWGDKILLGNISYQITGLSPFTDRPFATIGNDWALPQQILSQKQLEQYQKIATDIGQKLQQDGWKGLFGIDTVLNKKTGQIFLIEINARQPASTTYESQLQIQAREKSGQNNLVTTFEAHLASLLSIKNDNYQLVEIKDGAQIIQRVLNDKKTVIDLTGLKNLGLNIIFYNNIKPGADLVRLQSSNGIMKDHNEFNSLGEEIKSYINKKPSIQ